MDQSRPARSREAQSPLREVAYPRLGGSPIIVVERLDLDVLYGGAIEAAGVDAVAVRVRARNVKGLHATGPAEKMASGPSVESVLGEIIRAPQQAKARARHDQVQIAGHAA